MMYGIAEGIERESGEEVGGSASPWLHRFAAADPKGQGGRGCQALGLQVWGVKKLHLLAFLVPANE